MTSLERILGGVFFAIYLVVLPFAADPLFRGLDEGVSVYFVHSYCAVAEDPADVIAVTDYGAPVTAAVNHGLVYGCQFHPEKSGEVGLTILKNFGGLSR